MYSPLISYTPSQQPDDFKTAQELAKETASNWENILASMHSKNFEACKKSIIDTSNRGTYNTKCDSMTETQENYFKNLGYIVEGDANAYGVTHKISWHPLLINQSK